MAIFCYASGMRRAITILILLLIIIATFSYTVFYLGFRGGQRDYFNRHDRTAFERSGFLRTIYRLHDYGDGRADYLGNKYSAIQINVYAMQGLALDPDVYGRLNQEIQAVTGKSVSENTANVQITDLPNIPDDQVDFIASRYTAKTSTAPGAATLNLFLFSADQQQTDLLGKTHNENGIIIFVDALKNFTSIFPDTLQNYELSTVLHEFGHQLGLEHNDLPDCLMNPKAELNDTAVGDPADIVTDFCPAELQQIQQTAY